MGSAALPPFRAGRAVGVLAGVAAGGLVLSGLYAGSGVGIPCPFRALTGWDCPLCGGTRMGASLLHGDLMAAFWFNPLALVALVVFAALGALWLSEALGGPAFRPPARWAIAVRRFGSVRWLVVGLTGAVLYTLLRNLL